MEQPRGENKRFEYIQASKLINAKLFADRFDDNILSILPNEGSYLELGAGGGDYSKWLLDRKNFNVSYLLDFFNEPCARYGRWTAENHEQYVKDLLKDKNVITVAGNIDSTIKTLDQKFDYIYVDAAHDYESVYNYLVESNKIINDGGVIGINDYTFWGWFEQQEYECVEAVNKFLNTNSDWSVVGYALGYCGYSDIYIKKDA
jgi:hypothetical protein